MKKIILLLLVAAMLSCTSGKKNKPVGKKPVITVSILPQKTFVQKIAGDDFDVNVLIPPGASPAAYTLLPSQLKDIANSVAWLRMGYVGFELSWHEKIRNSNTNMKVYDLSEGIDLIAAGEEGDNGHKRLSGVDPHIWMSPGIVKKLAKKIRDILSTLNPDSAGKYLTNYTRFIKEINNVHVELTNILQPHKGKTVIVFHPSLSYFARDYGLNQVSLESGGKEPTPRHIKEVVDLANNKDIRVIYIQSELDLSHAKIFAEEIKGEIIQISPLSPDWSENLVKIGMILSENF